MGAFPLFFQSVSSYMSPLCLPLKNLPKYHEDTLEIKYSLIKYSLIFSVFSLKFCALNGLESSGRPVGIVSAYFHQNPSGGFRAMTKNHPKLTSI